MTRELWLVLAIAVVLHTLLAVTVAPRVEVDSAFYRAQAENLVAKGASLDATGQPETRYPPGYPLFLAAFLGSGLGYTGAMAAQHLIWIALAAAAMLLALRMSNSVIAAAIAGLITTLDLPGLQSSISVLSETLAAAMLTGAVLFTLRSIRADTFGAALRWAVLAGAFAGATALVRPIAVALGVPLAIAMAFGADRRWRAAAAAAALIVFSVLPIAWTIRNARQTGVAHFSSLAGINLLHFRAAGTLAIRDPGGLDANLVRRREELEQAACRNLEAAYRRPCASLSWAERSREYANVAWPVILGDPVASARQAARALAMTVFGGSANLVSEVTGLSERVARMISLVYTVPLALLAVLGIPYWWRRDRACAALILLVLLYMFGMALGAEAYSRFRVPVIVLYAVLCGGGGARLKELVLSARATT
jgi:hypothetical protein